MMELLHISMGGPNHKIIDATGKEWLFEMHPHCGPIPLRKDGEPRSRQPVGKSPFWSAVTCWALQGKKIDDNNYCVYTDKR